jgi:hypothetical protein
MILVTYYFTSDVKIRRERDPLSLVPVPAKKIFDSGIILLISNLEKIVLLAVKRAIIVPQ